MAVSGRSWIKRHGLKTVIVAVVLIVGASKLSKFIGSEKTADGTRITSSEKVRAEGATRTILLKGLKSPSSAVFSDFRIVKADPPYYQTAINVDSQNGFGAMLRSCHICVFKLAEGTQFYHKQGLSIDTLDSMDLLDHPNEIMEMVLKHQRGMNGWEPAEMDEAESKPQTEPKKEQPKKSPESVAANSDRGATASANPNSREDALTAAGPKGPSDSVIRRGLGFFNSDYETMEYRTGDTLISNDHGVRPALTPVFPVKISENPLTFRTVRHACCCLVR